MVDHGDTVALVEPTPERFAASRARFLALRDRVVAVVGDAVAVVHVGGSAVDGLVGKGDLDVNVVVAASDFAAVIARLDGDAAFVRDVGAYNSDSAVAVAVGDVAGAADAGVHVVVRGGADEEQWVATRALNQDRGLREALSAIKRQHDGESMDHYRAAKAAFFTALRQSPLFAAAKAMPSFPILSPIVVQWGDMDAYQHVNNVVYLRWFETARMALFRRLDFTSGTDVGPILHSTSCRYRVPVYAPDTVVAGVRVKDVGVDRFVLEMAVYSDNASAVAAVGDAVIVAYDYPNKRKASLPSAVCAILDDVVAEGQLIPELPPPSRRST